MNFLMDFNQIGAYQYLPLFIPFCCSTLQVKLGCTSVVASVVALRYTIVHMKVVALLVLVICFSVQSALSEQEEFLAIRAEAQIKPDNLALQVSEVFRVRVLGQKIKRAIGRAFPGSPGDRLNPQVQMITRGMVDLSGKSDQRPISAEIIDKNGIKSVIFGGATSPELRPGTYDYTFTYLLPDVIKVEEKIEGVFWYVTDFMGLPAKSVSAVFYPPPRVDPKTVKVNAFVERAKVGKTIEISRDGARAKINSTRDAARKNEFGEGLPKIEIILNDQLRLGERLMLEIAWPAGFVKKK